MRLRPVRVCFWLALLAGAAACSHPVTLTVGAGASLASVAALAQGAGLAEAAQLVTLAHDQAWLHTLGVDAPSLEGHLGPGVYMLDRDAGGTRELLTQMVRAQQHVLAETGQAATWDGSVAQVMALACRLDRETRNAEERALVASVAVNRQRRGWAPWGVPTHGEPTPCTPSREALDAAFHPRLEALFTFPSVPDGRPVLKISEEERRAMDAIEPDPQPPQITRGMHYFRSNEKQPEQFRSRVAGQGRVMIGVGSEQNYTLAAWAHSDILVLMDFDTMIPQLHGAYRVAFLESPTPDALVELWSDASRKRFEKLINAHFSNAKEAAATVFAYRTARERVATELNELRAHYRELKVPSFLTNEEQYAYVVALYRNNRVLRIRGDLTAHTTMRQLGAHFTKAGRTVGLLYMSNAEEYFPFTPDYRANINALPTDERSLILRTVRSGEDYTYITQSFVNARAWLADASVLGTDAFVPTKPKRKKLVTLDITALPAAH